MTTSQETISIPELSTAPQVSAEGQLVVRVAPLESGLGVGLVITPNEYVIGTGRVKFRRAPRIATIRSILIDDSCKFERTAIRWAVSSFVDGELFGLLVRPLARR